MPDIPTYGLVRPKTMAAAATDEIRRRILTGDLPPGFQLRQDVLAEELGVSRIPLREALVQLEAEGLVRIAPHRGAVVSEISPPEIAEMFELRSLLEPTLLRGSAPRLDCSDYQRLEANIAEYAAEIRIGNVGRWGELNRAFHLLLYGRAERPNTLAIVANLLDRSDRSARLQLSLTGGVERSQKEHTEIVRLCVIGEVEAACGLLRSHIDNAAASLLASLAKAAPAP